MSQASQRTFVRVDHEIFSSLWRWARRRHPNKNTRWRKQKYFASQRGRDWSFFGATWDDDWQPSQVWLRHARSTPIKRHVKVKGDTNPYDPAYESYFEQREGIHMQETFQGTRTLRFLWQEQHGLCTVCNTKITRITDRLAPSPLRSPRDGWMVNEAQKTACDFIRSAMTEFTASTFLS